MAKLTPGASQGGVQPSSATEFDPAEGPKPTTGFVEAPTVDSPKGGPGPGIGGKGRGIH